MKYFFLSLLLSLLSCNLSDSPPIGNIETRKRDDLGTKDVLPDQREREEDGSDASSSFIGSDFFPTNNATAVDSASTISFFVPALNAESLDSANFFLQSADSETIIGAQLKYDAETQRAVLTPNASLVFSTTYIATYNSLQNESGELIKPHSWQFTIRAGAWTTPRQLSNPGKTIAEEPRIAHDRAGNAAAIWKDGDDEAFFLGGRYYSKSTGWQAPVTFPSDSRHLDLSMGSDGKIHLGWVDPAVNPARITTIILDPAQNNAALLSLSAARETAQPTLQSGDSGEILAVWRQYDGMKWNRFSSIFVNGRWIAGGNIDSLGDNVLGLALSMNSKGENLSLWRTENAIWSASFENQNGWSQPGLVSSIDFPELLDLKISDSGTAIAAWTTKESNAGGRKLWVGIHTSQDPDWLIERIPTPDVDLGQPQVGIDSQDNAILLWQQGSSDRTARIFTARYLSTSGWGAPSPLSEVGADSINADLAMNLDGRAVAAWQQSEGGNYHVQTAIFDGNEWGITESIDPIDAETTARSIRVSMARSGEAMVIWATGKVGPTTRIVLSQFE